MWIFAKRYSAGSQDNVGARSRVPELKKQWHFFHRNGTAMREARCCRAAIMTYRGMIRGCCAPWRERDSRSSQSRTLTIAGGNGTYSVNAQSNLPPVLV